MRKRKDIDHDLLWNTAYLGHNRLCAISIKVTGNDSKLNELVQICCFPLNSRFDLAKDIIPFYMDIKPLKSEEDIDPYYIQTSRYKELIESNANTAQIAAELFDKWMIEKLRLSDRKKILPVVYDWAFSKSFIKNWLGPINFESYFSHNYRDILSIALFCNDYFDRLGRDVPYLKTTLITLSKTFHVEYHRHNETILQCKAISEVYQELMKGYYP